MPQPTQITHDPQTTGVAYAVDAYEQDANAGVVALHGEIDLAAAPAVKSALLDLLHSGHRRFTVDLSEVDHIDSTGLGVLVAFQRRLGDEGRLALAGARPHVLRILELTGLTTRFTLVPTDAHARRTTAVCGPC
jgi:anti-anti-sigma factor